MLFNLFCGSARKRDISPFLIRLQIVPAEENRNATAA